MQKTFSITLTEKQMQHAKQVADELHSKLRKRRVKDAHGLRKEDATQELEWGGAAAELAASIILDVPWTASMSNDKYGPDIGKRTQIRSSLKPRDSHHLIVRPKDIEKYHDVPFILVIQTGRKFDMLGWMMSFEAIKIGKLWNGGHSARPDAWFVHQDKLLPLTELKEV